MFRGAGDLQQGQDVKSEVRGLTALHVVSESDLVVNDRLVVWSQLLRIHRRTLLSPWVRQVQYLWYVVWVTLIMNRQLLQILHNAAPKMLNNQSLDDIDMLIFTIPL